MLTRKPSISGLIEWSDEVARFENLFYKIVTSAYYNPDAGLDWNFWLGSNFELPLQSFLSYVAQEAAKVGIIVDEINGEIRNFTLEIFVVIDGNEHTFNTTTGD